MDGVNELKQKKKNFVSKVAVILFTGVNELTHQFETRFQWTWKQDRGTQRQPAGKRTSIVNILRQRQNGPHFADIFKSISINEHFRVLNKISLKYVP